MNSVTRSTTVIVVKRGKHIAMAGDGQVTMGETVVKASTHKVRKIYHENILVGFAGATADALTLLQYFENNLNKYSGDMPRAAVELAKEWRTEKILRRLEALMVCADRSNILLLSGTGDVIEPDDDVIAIGSGGNFANAAALALKDNTKLSAADIAVKSLQIAAKICIYTNNHITMEELHEE